MDQLPVSALRPEFRQGLAKLLAMIEGSISPKMFRGSYLTGGALSQFARVRTGGMGVCVCVCMCVFMCAL